MKNSGGGGKKEKLKKLTYLSISGAQLISSNDSMLMLVLKRALLISAFFRLSLRTGEWSTYSSNFSLVFVFDGVDIS